MPAACTPKLITQRESTAIPAKLQCAHLLLELALTYLVLSQRSAVSQLWCCIFIYFVVQDMPS